MAAAAVHGEESHLRVFPGRVLPPPPRYSCANDPRHRRRRLHRLQLHPGLARARRGRAGRQRRQADLRRQYPEPRHARRRRPLPPRPRRHLRPRRGGPPLRRASAARRRALRRREPRRSLDPRPGRLHPDERRRHLQPARSRARPLGRPGRRGETGVPLPARLDRRGLRLARPRRPCVQRDHPIRPEQSLLGVEGRARIISSVRTTTPMACRQSRPTARTTTVRGSSRRN